MPAAMLANVIYAVYVQSFAISEEPYMLSFLGLDNIRGEQTTIPAVILLRAVSLAGGWEGDCDGGAGGCPLG